jgi:hypothetical protein
MARGQVNPHTQIRWPSSCTTAGTVYNPQSNSCVALSSLSGQVTPSSQINWPPSCNAAGMVYNFQSNSCISTAGVTWRGAWTAGTYALNDMVSYQNNSYISTAAGNTTTPPSASWALMAAQGGTGPAFNGGTITNPLIGPDGTFTTTTASVNKIISVIAPPYNAKCDGTTTDTTAIQAAFDAALSGGQSVQFPAGTCKTGTIVFKGQGFFGAGIALTTIQGLPGQDVFQTPDGNTWSLPVGGTRVHDLKILVDNTVDASGAPQGNNTFPNRVAGTLGNGTAVSPAIAPGPTAFGTYNGLATGCTGTILIGSLNTLTLTGAFCASGLNNLDSWRTVGAPITVQGVGVAGADLVTTIASVTGSRSLTLTTPATSAGTNLSGTMMNPVTPPWYMGNCAFAFPDSNGATPSPNINGWVFENIYIQKSGGPSKGNHSCGIFMQAPPYATKFQNVQIQDLWGGYVEAKPTTNAGSSTWTGDTSSFKNMDLQFNEIPFVIMGGNYRTFDGINIYGGVQFQTLGPMWIENGSSGTINQLYFECGQSTGEVSRYTGSAAGFRVSGGTLNACTAIPYVYWNASNSEISSQVNNLQISPTATNVNVKAQNLKSQFFTDTGFSNAATSNYGTNPTLSPRVGYLNRPQEPVGKLDSSFLLSGNSASPYLNASDLVTTCIDMGIFFNSPGSVGSCVSDTSGTELPLKYFQSFGATTVVDGLNNGGVANTWSIFPRLFGTSIPRTKVTVYVLGECVGTGSCTGTLSVKDGTANSTFASAAMTFGSTWTLQSMTADLSAATVGNVLDYRLSTWTNVGTNYNIAYIAIQPVNVDDHAWHIANGLPVTSSINLKVVDTSGAGLTTGPASSTDTHIAVFDGTSGKIKDGGSVPAAIVTSVPIGLQYYGDGSEGALTCPSGTCVSNPGSHYYSTCSVSAGAILSAQATTVPTGVPLILHCATSATIAGTISYSFNTGSSTGVFTADYYGGGGGGGGFGAANGTAGSGYLGTSGAGTAGTSGVAGGAGTATPVYVRQMMLDSLFPYTTSTPCGGSAGGTGGSSGGAAGRGGGCVIIISPSINFTGTVDVSGVNGGAGGANTGGGGGGAGGVVIMRSPSMTNSGTITLTGGTGGPIGSGTSTAGGNGATGWSKAYSQ